MVRRELHEAMKSPADYELRIKGSPGYSNIDDPGPLANQLLNFVRNVAMDYEWNNPRFIENAVQELEAAFIYGKWDYYERAAALEAWKWIERAMQDAPPEAMEKLQYAYQMARNLVAL